MVKVLWIIIVIEWKVCMSEDEHGRLSGKQSPMRTEKMNTFQVTRIVLQPNKSLPQNTIIELAMGGRLYSDKP